jgi:hypothetical protein
LSSPGILAGGIVQISNVASQLQQQLINNANSTIKKPTAPTPTPTKIDNDGDTDNGAPDKGGSLDTKG